MIPRCWPTVLPTAWDLGITWHFEQLEAPAASFETAFVRDSHLRSPNGGAEDTYIAGLITTSARMAERMTRRAHMPRLCAMVLSGFPAGRIEVERSPLIEVVSIEYFDESGAEQTMDADAYQTSGSRDVNRRFVIEPAPDGSWPGTRSGRLESVTITYRAGYESAGSPVVADVPEDILHGQLLVIGEMYKQRSESIIGFGTSVQPALVRARDLWLGHRIY